MKKKVSCYFLILVLVLGMAGCSKKNETTNAELEDEEETEDTTKDSSDSKEDDTNDTESGDNENNDDENYTDENSDDENNDENGEDENGDGDSSSASSNQDEEEQSNAIPDTTFTAYNADGSATPLENFSGIEVKDGTYAVKPLGELGDIADFEKAILQQNPEWEKGNKLDNDFYEWYYTDGKQTAFLKSKSLYSVNGDSLSPNFSDMNYCIQYNWDNRISEDPSSVKVLFGRLADINEGKEILSAAGQNRIRPEFLAAILNSYRQDLVREDENDVSMTIKCPDVSENFSIDASRTAEWPASKEDGAYWPYLNYDLHCYYNSQDKGAFTGNELSPVEAFKMLPYDFTQFSCNLNPLALANPEHIWISKRAGVKDTTFELKIEGHDKDNQKVEVNASMNKDGKIYSLYYKFEDVVSSANSLEELKAELCDKLKVMLGADLKPGDITEEDGNIELEIPVIIFNKSTVMNVTVGYAGYNDNPEFNIDYLYINYNIYEN